MEAVAKVSSTKGKRYRDRTCAEKEMHNLHTGHRISCLVQCTFPIRSICLAHNVFVLQQLLMCVISHFIIHANSHAHKRTNTQACAHVFANTHRH